MTSVWQELHSNYKAQDWVGKPSLFAETAIQYFPKIGKVLELGAGHGQDSLFFAKRGYEVVSTDIETTSLALNVSKQDCNVRVMDVNLLEPLPFDNSSFDVVYAHLSLHYFELEKTYEIMNEISRILKPGGVIAFLTNSTSDPEYNTGLMLEPDFFQVGKATKRYLSVDSARKLTRDFQANLVDDMGQTYKDQAKGIHNLIRFIGKKPLEKNFTMAIPYVAAIIEREKNGEIELLIQTRHKPNNDPLYTGTFEFPAGTLDKPYENIFDALAREIDEECGLKLKSIKSDSKTKTFKTDKDDAVFGFKPFCCTQQLKNGKPWIGFVFICEVEDVEPKTSSNESQDVRWINAKEMKQIFTETPDKLFTLELPAWEYYFRSII